MALFFYYLLTVPVSGILYITQRRWIRSGKEDPLRAPERWGKAGIERDATHRLVWFHAASVGESVALLDIIRKILAENPGWRVLVTTVTRTSAAVMAESLPKGAVHQMLPFEHRPAIRRFLNHWSPDLVVWTESDIWPVALSEIHRRKIPAVMVNGVISERSYLRLKRFRQSIAKILSPFETALIKDDAALARYRELGLANGNLICVGSLKEATAEVAFNPAHLTEIRQAINDRPVWLAGSTHPGEFEQIIKAHQQLLGDIPDLLLIHAPRHPQDAGLIKGAAQTLGWQTALRSKGELPTDGCKMYIADTIGEMGLWHRVSPVSFIGGSLSDDMGHNPFEAAALGSAILYGWSIGHFEEVYQRYSDAGGAIQVQDAVELSENVAKLMQPDFHQMVTKAASDTRLSAADAFLKTFAFLNERLGKFGNQ